MKSVSLSKNIDNNYNNKVSLINKKNEIFGNKKRTLVKKGKSYSNLMTDINREKTPNKITEEEIKNNLETSFRLNDKIDYAKKIKQAKEIEDLRKIYEKWSGERTDLLNKTKSLIDDDFILQKFNSNNGCFLSGYKKEKKDNNNRYKNVLDNENKIKQELNLINTNNLLEKNKSKPIIINFKNQNYLFNKNKNKDKNKSIEENKIKEELKKLNNSFEVKKNKQIDIKIRKLFLPRKNFQANSKKNKSFLEENKIKKEIKNINNKNKLKSLKEEISETNDESISYKINNKKKLDISKNIIDEKKIIDIKIKQSLDEDAKYKKKLKIRTSKIRITTNKGNENIDIKNIIKKAYLFSEKNQNGNLVEKLECALDLDKYIQNEIKMNKDNNLLLPEEAVYYLDNVIIRFLGYFGSELKLRNIKTYIEKNPTKRILREISFKLISTGLAFQKIYKIMVESEENRKKYEKKNEEYLDFLKSLKIKISNKYSISEDDIYIFGFNLENFEVYLLIYNKKIDGVEEYLKHFDLKITTSLLLNNIILSPNIFEINFSKSENDWSKKNLTRGGRKYHPPHGWNGIGLKLKNKYGDNKNNDNNIWLGKQNLKGEWCVAYHGVGKGNIFDKVLKIINGDLKDEKGKLFKNDINIENTKNKYPYCGEGVYLSPNIEDAAIFADKTNLGCFNLKFQFAFMTRVNPNKIRSPGGFPVKWILNGNNDEIRPYRLLIRISSN